MDERPYGAHKYLYCPNGVMNVVNSWLSLANGHWLYSLAALMIVKYLALLAAMSATGSVGVGD